MFYEQLKKACKSNGTTVTAVLKKIGIGTANGTYWKNGSVPSSDIVVQLSEFLGVSTDYLLKGDELQCETVTIRNQNPTITNSNNVKFGGIINEKSNSKEFEMQETTKELVKVFESLPTKERIKLMNIVYEYEEKYREDNNT